MSSLDYLNKGVKQMENSNNSKFEGISIKIPKAKFMKSDKSMAYKHGDAPKRFLNPLRDWIQSDRVRNKRKNEGYMLGVGGKTEAYEDSNNPNFQIENLVITFYLYKPQSKPYQRPQYQQGQGYSNPVNQGQNMVEQQDDMDAQLPTEKAPVK